MVRVEVEFEVLEGPDVLVLGPGGWGIVEVGKLPAHHSEEEHLVGKRFFVGSSAFAGFEEHSGSHQPC